MESRAVPDWHWAVGSETGGGTHERAAEVIRYLMRETALVQEMTIRWHRLPVLLFLSVHFSIYAQISDQLEEEENGRRLGIMGEGHKRGHVALHSHTNTQKLRTETDLSTIPTQKYHMTNYSRCENAKNSVLTDRKRNSHVFPSAAFQHLPQFGHIKKHVKPSGGWLLPHKVPQWHRCEHKSTHIFPQNKMTHLAWKARPATPHHQSFISAAQSWQHWPSGRQNANTVYLIYTSEMLK